MPSSYFTRNMGKSGPRLTGALAGGLALHRLGLAPSERAPFQFILKADTFSESCAEG